GDARLGARALLGGDVDGRPRVVADQHGGEAGRLAVFLDEVGDAPGDVGAHGGRDGPPVDHDRGAHRFLTGAISAIRFFSRPEAKRTTITPPAGSVPVTTPSPKAAWTTSSPTR